MAADTSYPNGFQVRQDGNAVVPTGKSLDIESGGLFKIAGTTVTATAAEVNKLTGNTGSTSVTVVYSLPVSGDITSATKA